jgi:predicted methyltransferase
MRALIIVILSFAVMACDQTSETTPGSSAAAPTTAPAVSAPDIYDTAVADAARPESDRLRDAGRRPAEVLRFFGIEPGMQVLDVFAGGGYYTEIVSNLVGPDGSVLMYNNPTYVSFTQDELDARFTEGRFPGVERLTTEVADLELPEGRFDAALFILAYHDVYWVDERFWPEIDAPTMLSEIHRSLRSGAVVGVVDHAAQLGTGTGAASSLHRIERSALIADFEAAGFVLEDETDLLANAEDDRSRHSSEADLRGRTDRFVLRFRRP